jgi:ribosomal protein L11 methyltransferase
LRWLEVTVTTLNDSSEAVTERLLSLGANGVSLEENWDWEKARRDGLGDIFPAQSITTEDSAIIRGYLPLSFLGSENEILLRKFIDGLPGYGLAPAELSCREVNDIDWEDAWKQYWQATPVGKKLLILPAWLDAEAYPDRIVMRLDPGPAFGTGTHETTRLCLELLEEQVTGQETVLDLGCGSGILSMAARMLCAGRVLGVDSDKTAVRFSQDNARLNGLDQVHFQAVDLTKEQSWNELLPANIILANLTADLLISIKEMMLQVLLPGGRVIASGIILQRADEVISSYQDAGFTLLQRVDDGAWTALLLGDLR